MGPSGPEAPARCKPDGGTATDYFSGYVACNRFHRMKFAAVVNTSRQVAETRGRRDKIALLAALLAETPVDEIEIATSYLSGAVRQDKLGLGWATIQSAMPDAGRRGAVGRAGGSERGARPHRRDRGQGLGRVETDAAA